MAHLWSSIVWAPAFGDSQASELIFVDCTAKVSQLHCTTIVKHEDIVSCGSREGGREGRMLRINICCALVALATGMRGIQ